MNKHDKASPEERHELNEEYLPVLSSLPYQALREAFYITGFDHSNESAWPTVSLDKGTTQGYAQLMPPGAEALSALSAEQREAFISIAQTQAQEMSDLDADVLDGMAAHWLRTKNASGSASATVDDFLRMRQIQPKVKEDGSRGGYRPKERKEMLRALSRHQSLWLNMAQVETYDIPDGRRRPRRVRRSIQSRAFIITDRLGNEMPDGSFRMERFHFRPGDVFAAFLEGPGRQTALLSAKALAYDPYRQVYEKRLTRYLSWQWRVKQRSGSLLASYKVQTLLDNVGLKFVSRRASGIRERLETALDTLEADGVTREWHYEGEEPPSEKQHGWSESWLASNILIEPPEEIVEQYASIPARDSGLADALSASPEDIGRSVKRRRRELGLSQLQLAEAINVKQAYISYIESGKRIPPPGVRGKLESWLRHQEPD